MSLTVVKEISIFTFVRSADGVVSWGRQALEWYSYELGSDSDLVVSMRNVIASPQTHSAWGSRIGLRVSSLTP